jgi:hypothetical protein
MVLFLGESGLYWQTPLPTAEHWLAEGFLQVVTLHFCCRVFTEAAALETKGNTVEMTK